MISQSLLRYFKFNNILIKHKMVSYGKQTIFEVVAVLTNILCSNINYYYQILKNTVVIII